MRTFKPDYSNLRGTITIDVYGNCNALRVVSTKGSTPLNYHEIIGALEVLRTNMIIEQTKINRAASKRKY